MKRFWDKVEKTDKCWNWKAGIRGENGYGCFKVNGKNENSHRVSWRITFGEIPEGLLVCHHCDNRLCVRPEHLFLGTYKDNMQDCSLKGRIVTFRKGKIFTKHGTTTMYNLHKCRCNDCKLANSQALKKSRAKNGR